MPVSDGSSEDEAETKREEQPIKKAVALPQVICAFLTVEICLLLIGKREIVFFLFPGKILARMFSLLNRKCCFWLESSVLYQTRKT